jgi:2-iminobutanoate/2-iminopropanoate deaminase
MTPEPAAFASTSFAATSLITTPRRGLHSERFPKPVASYSQGFQVGQMVFITGQLPVDPASGEKVGDGDIVLEARQTLRNFMAVLEAAGCSARDVVSAVIYLTDIDTLDTVDAVWQEFFTDPDNYPSRAVVEVSALVLGIQLEISGIAIKDLP